MEEEEDAVSSRAIVSAFLPELTIRKEEYDDLWKYKDESSNPRQHAYYDIIENEQMTAMENELRKIVDEMMRSELQLLQVSAFARTMVVLSPTLPFLGGKRQGPRLQRKEAEENQNQEREQEEQKEEGKRLDSRSHN